MLFDNCYLVALVGFCRARSRAGPSHFFALSAQYPPGSAVGCGEISCDRRWRASLAIPIKSIAPSGSAILS